MMTELDLQHIIQQKIDSDSVEFNNLPITDEHIIQICQNYQKRKILLSGTKITDNALKHLATVSGLEYLHLDNTQITGQGFVHFLEHKKLSCVYLENTQINDETLKIIAKIPKIEVVSIQNTPTTWQGVLAIAENPIICPITRGKQFSDEQMREFRHVQRQFAKKNKQPVNDDDLAKAKAHLLAFFDAIHAWSKIASQNFSDEVMNQSTDIFKQYCTETQHNKRKRSVSFSEDGGEYATHQIVDSEQISKNRIYLYTEDCLETQHRFLFIRQTDGSWLIDKRQIKFGGKWQTFNF